jgi:hypothetical protein
MSRDKCLKKPSVNQVDIYLEKWNKDKLYVENDALVRNMFIQCFRNIDLEVVLDKIIELNKFYNFNFHLTEGKLNENDPGLNLFFKKAEDIVSLKIDEKLKNGNFNLVLDIAETRVGSRREKLICFASAYCNFHWPDLYPMYSRSVRKALLHVNNKYNFAEFEESEIKGDYLKFVEILNQFIDNFDLIQFSYKEIDQYLWQLGQEI